MSATGEVYVEDIAAALAVPYTSVRVYRGTTTDPATAAFTTLVTTITLVAGTLQYSFTDSAATADTLWRTSYFNTTTSTESGLGPIIRPAASNPLRLIRREAVTQANMGFGSACSGAGTTTTLIDAALADTGVDTAFLEGAWLYRPDAALAADKLRRVKKDGYTAATGTLSIDRAWTNLPASAEAYEVYNGLPPIDAPGAGYSWARACRDGLEKSWFIDRVNLGEGTSTRQTRFSLATWPDINENTIRRVFLRTTDNNGIITDVDARSRGSDWQKVMESGALSIEFVVAAPTTNQTVIVEAVRTDGAVYIDTDVTLTPLRLAVRATVWQAMVHTFGEQSVQAVGAYRDWAAEQTRQHAGDLVTT